MVDKEENLRYWVEPTYVEGFGDCFKLNDNCEEMETWYSMSSEDINYLCDYLNNQDKRNLLLVDLNNELSEFKKNVLDFIDMEIDGCNQILEKSKSEQSIKYYKMNLIRLKKSIL